jgi:hypothetical protein
MSARPPLAAHDLDALVAAYREGVALAALGVAYDRSLDEIRALLVEAGVRMPARDTESPHKFRGYRH